MIGRNKEVTEMRKKKIHYAGPIRTHRVRVLAGWAACCSGSRAVQELRQTVGSYRCIDSCERREYQVERILGGWLFSSRHCTVLEEGAVRGMDDFQVEVPNG